MSDTSTTPLPDSIAHYRILELIGEGATSRVYKAQDDRDDRVVALKVLELLGQQAVEPTLRLKREFRAIQRLEHPNIVRVFELGEGPPAYIAMEFVEGSNLGRALGLTPHSALAEDRIPELLAILAQVLEALSYVHSQQVLHRDLKPENVLVGLDGGVKLVDFGLATFSDQSGTRLTLTGAVVGTPRYLSPEQALGGRLDGRSDLYSLGTVAYECLTGVAPFEGRTLAEALMRRLNEAPAPVTFRAPETPAGLAEFVHKLIEREREQRYASADEALEALRTLDSAAVVGAAAAPRMRRTLLAPRFVGRSEALALARAAIEDADAGHPRMILVEGEAGLGKTRLIEEVVRHVRLADWLVLEAGAFEGASLPYAAFERVFEKLASELSRTRGEQARQAAQPLAGALGAVHAGFHEVPGFAEAKPEAGLAPREGQRQVFEGLLRILSTLARSRPIVLRLDDLHHFDASSVELLVHLEARLVARPGAEPPRIALVVGLRPDECRSDETTHRWLESRREAPTTADVVLEPLSVDEVAQVLSSMLGETRQRSEAAQWLHTVTGGNPFFVEETIKSLCEEQVVTHSRSGWSVGTLSAPRGRPSDELPLEAFAIPDKLRLTVERRLRPLGPAPLALLQRASVLGRDFDIRVLAAMSDMSQDALLDSLDVLIREGLLLEPRSSADRLGFCHDLLREVLHAKLPRVTRRRLHARAATAYSDREGDAALVARAYHAAAADDVEAALEALPRAAQRLLELHDGQGTLRLLREYTRVEANLDEPSRFGKRTERHAILAQLARVELLVGLPARAEDDAKALIDSAQKSDDALALSDGHRLLAEALFRQGQFENGRVAAEAALEGTLEHGDAPRQIRSRLTLARNLVGVSDYDVASHELELAEHLAESVGDDVLRLAALSELGALEFNRARYAQAIAAQERCTEIAAHAGRIHDTISTLRRLATALTHIGQLERASELFRRAIEHATDTGNSFSVALCQDNLAHCRHELGDLEEAEKLHRTALEQLSDAGEFRPAVLSAVGLSDVLFDLGRYDESRSVLETVLGDARIKGLRREGCYPLINLAQIEIEQGSLDVAANRLQVAVANCTASQDDFGLAAALRLEGRIELAAGSPQAASVVFARCFELFGKLGVERGLALSFLDHGATALAQKRTANALELFDKTRELATTHHFAIERLAASVGKARTLAAAQPSEAANIARDTFEESSAAGLKLLAAEAALVIVRTAQAEECEPLLEHVLSISADLHSPLLLFRVHSAALSARVGDPLRHRNAALRALAQLEPLLGRYRDGFMRREDVLSVQRPT